MVDHSYRRFNFPSVQDDSFDVRNRLSADILLKVSAIAFAYNQAEATIDDAIAIALRVGRFPELTSRINGIDGRIEVLKALLKRNRLIPEAQQAIATTLGEGAFGLIKRKRDDIIHSIVLAHKDEAQTVAKRGKIRKFAMTEEFLEGVLSRSMIINCELSEMFNICILQSSLIDFTCGEPMLGAVTYRFIQTLGGDTSSMLSLAPHSREIDTEIREYLSRLQEHQNRRLSLPPLPEVQD